MGSWSLYLFFWPPLFRFPRTIFGRPVHTLNVAELTEKDSTGRASALSRISLPKVWDGWAEDFPAKECIADEKKENQDQRSQKRRKTDNVIADALSRIEVIAVAQEQVPRSHTNPSITPKCWRWLLRNRELSLVHRTRTKSKQKQYVMEIKRNSSPIR